jgi:hypothetical protein
MIFTTNDYMGAVVNMIFCAASFLLERSEHGQKAKKLSPERIETKS